jgi:hypothetical protein
MRRTTSPLWGVPWQRIGLAMLIGVTVVDGKGLAQDDRPTPADVMACSDIARAEVGTAYTERAPVSPFPSRTSGVGPWTGPVTGTRAPRAEQPDPLALVDTPATSGVFGAGGESQEAMSEPGPVDPRFQEVFDACMRARGF